MATYTCKSATHQTLTQSTVDTITVTGTAKTLCVYNRGTDYLYVTKQIEEGESGVIPVQTATGFVDPSTTAELVPTVGGDDCLVVGPGVALELDYPGMQGPLVIKLISASATAYSVQVY